MPSTTTTSSTTSAISSPVSATTPLLPSHGRPSRPISTRSRPRSRTVAGLPITSSSPEDVASSSTPPSLEQLEEKRAAGLAEWRRRYGGKQRECVVCLEEYVDGVSRVMSLPCGHEFHAECITPWLTTRRRTCPICKGDVVRSLARSGGTGSSTGGGASSVPSATSPFYPVAFSSMHSTNGASHDDEDEHRDGNDRHSSHVQEYAELLLVDAVEEDDDREHSAERDGPRSAVDDLEAASLESQRARCEEARGNSGGAVWDRTR